MSDIVHAGQACIPALHQPALALDFALARELTPQQAYKGLDQRDLDAGALIAPAQYLRLLANVASSLARTDTSFLLGQQMLPGHFGALSHALMHAHCLRDALTLLTRHQVALCPLLAPHLCEEGDLAILYWTDSAGSGAQRGFLVEMHMTAVSAMCRWLSGAPLPWHFCFNRTQPRYTEQHEVHLGTDLRFNCHLDAMLIDAAWLDRPWPRSNAVAVRAAAAVLPQRTFLVAVHDYLIAHIRCAPTLEQCASAFAVSAATFKRHLAAHGSNFQAELDMARSHVALRLFQRGEDNDAVARHLGFHDANNFRRSYKRWTGITPMLVRASLAAYRLQSR
ncbi:AraC family transcriptional regulator [Massilia sp. CF038]|uniref:AraC family transcriptional regulator n=1 Tax=Massilia sp. CF038 TaxID=1881045 RepID=UPI000918EBA4|nr:AraC family transcriptional regulator [Massilia sp. CF038]SHH13293.1 AraC-type DNA-binding protein [Massilia sp. CF038]